MWQGNINNGTIWILRTPAPGYARFDEYGEVLQVWDTSSNGKRIWVSMLDCRYGTWTHYSSGPNEGPTDHEVHDFSLPEGLTLVFQVCEGTSITNRSRCGSPVGANA